MGNNVKSIICPQCGSAVIEMLSTTQGICKACGTRFSVTSPTEAQDDSKTAHGNTTGGPSEEADSCVKVKILPEFSKKQFVEKVWATLAAEDAPDEVFNENFDSVSEIEYEVLVSSISAEVSYHVSIGNNRQEPYIDYETYYEKEPYLDYETYFENGERKQRPITKYKKVERQRQVTKYKTVTDWTPQTGNQLVNSFTIVKNKGKRNFDKSLFQSSFKAVKNHSKIPIPAGEELEITDAAHNKAMSNHRDDIFTSVESSLSGDYNKGLNCQLSNITSSSMALYKTIEYELSLYYKGKPYTKRAFPFGAMIIGGDKIPNGAGIEAMKNEMTLELQASSKKKKNEIPEVVWRSSKVIQFVSAAILVLSILVSWFVHEPIVAIIVFAVAVGAYVYKDYFVKKSTNDATKKIDDEIKKRSSTVRKEIAEYSSNYKLKKQELLQKKLKSLGYESEC